MTTSGTFNFMPSLGDVFHQAYGRIQMRRNAVTMDHLVDAAFAANLVQVDWANEQVNLWTVDLQTQVLSPTVPTYNVDPSTVMIMAAYIETGTNPPIGRIITSIDRDTYASYPDKVTTGQPTVYWYNRQINPTITLWQPPDNQQTYTLKYYRARQIQDASAPQGLTPEVPYRFLSAYVAALAYKLAESYNPNRLQELAVIANESFRRAAQRDVENAPLRIVPALSAYTSRVY